MNFFTTNIAWFAAGGSLTIALLALHGRAARIVALCAVVTTVGLLLEKAPAIIAGMDAVLARFAPSARRPESPRLPPATATAEPGGGPPPARLPGCAAIAMSHDGEYRLVRGTGDCQILRADVVTRCRESAISCGSHGAGGNLVGLHCRAWLTPSRFVRNSYVGVGASPSLSLADALDQGARQGFAQEHCVVRVHTVGDQLRYAAATPH